MVLKISTLHPMYVIFLLHNL